MISPMPPAKDSLRSTFPIPAAKLNARKWKIALGSPVTWAPYLPVAGAFAFFDIGPLLFAGLAAVVTAGISIYWKSHHNKLESKLLDDLIEESNEAQNVHLVEEARKLHKAGCADYATTLGSFLEKKQKIESAIHSEGSGLTPEKQEIEMLVDSVVFGVADQLGRLAELDKRLSDSPIQPTPEKIEQIEKAQKDISDRVYEAWDVVEETWGKLGELIDPSAGLEGEEASHPALDHAIERLRREHEIAARVRSRLAEEWDGVSEPPATSEIE